MKTRELGTEGLKVSEIGLGCMSMAPVYGPTVDKEAGIALIRSAHDQGVTFFDTAEAYGPFTNESIVGEALQPIRDQVIVATKFGFDIQDGKMVGVNSRPENIKAVADASLKRFID